MYSRKSWGGSTDPFILLKFIKASPEDNSEPIVSTVIFEWSDEDLLGRYPSPESDVVSKDVVWFDYIDVLAHSFL